MVEGDEEFGLRGVRLKKVVCGCGMVDVDVM